MSNDSYNHFQPGMIRVEGNVVNHHVAMDLPDGREAMVGVRVGLEGPADAAEQREKYLLEVYPPSLTEGLERELEQMAKLFDEFNGYDRDGKPHLRVTGRDRVVLEMKIANRRNALVLARRERALAERMQAEARAKKQAEETRIAAAAETRAQQMIEEAEVERRAKQIAASRAGIR